MSSLSIYDPAAWEQAREDYLCGMTAADVCRRHGVSRSQFYAQARAGGWRRADQTATPAPLDDDAGARPTRELAGDALRRAASALALGRLGEARGWTRLASDLRALAVQETGSDSWAYALKCWAAEAEAESAQSAQAQDQTQARAPARAAGLPDPPDGGSPAAPAAQVLDPQGPDRIGPDSPESPAATRSPAEPQVSPPEAREPGAPQPEAPQPGPSQPGAPPVAAPADPVEARDAAELQAWRGYCARMRQARPAELLWTDMDAALAACARMLDELGPIGPLGLGRPPDG